MHTPRTKSSSHTASAVSLASSTLAEAFSPYCPARSLQATDRAMPHRLPMHESPQSPHSPGSSASRCPISSFAAILRLMTAVRSSFAVMRFLRISRISGEEINASFSSSFRPLSFRMASGSCIPLPVFSFTNFNVFLLGKYDFSFLGQAIGQLRFVDEPKRPVFFAA